MTNVSTSVQQAPQIQVAKPGELVDGLLARIASFQSVGDLKLPTNYSAENSVRAAWLILQETTNREGVSVLTTCTSQSIANSLLKMVLQGLNPNKRQCSFIAYGNKLTLQREYAGSIAIAKRNGMKNITANVVYEGDEFEFIMDVETGLKKITKHVQSLTTMSGGKIVGAYAYVEMEDGRKSVEVMTMAQVQSAWNQGPTKGQSPAHKNFPDQMAMKTVINRAVKILINSSDDGDLFTDESENEIVEGKAEVIRQEIVQQANKEEIGFGDADLSNIANNATAPVVADQPELNQQPAQEQQSSQQTGPGF